MCGVHAAICTQVKGCRVVEKRNFLALLLLRRAEDGNLLLLLLLLHVERAGANVEALAVAGYLMGHQVDADPRGPHE
jgi:hypothetical protein